MMEYQTLIVEKKNRVGVITLNRPEVRNALNTQLSEEMIEALQGYDKDPEVVVIIITGAGAAFCSGHDFSELQGKTLTDFRRTFVKSVQVLQTMAGISKAVIAAVNGYATAMGCALAAGCDLVVASEEAKFQTPGVNIGFACVTPMAAIYRSVGRKKCLEMIITGEAIDANEAERIGLVNKVVPQKDLEKAAFELAEKIASKAPLALQFGKQAFYAMADMQHDQAYKYAVEMISLNADTEDGREGMAAFLEKRPMPEWKGR
ncbi:enoyl-CoA hydratase-related protein [Chloroflexota bacterium]